MKKTLNNVKNKLCENIKTKDNARDLITLLENTTCWLSRNVDYFDDKE